MLAASSPRIALADPEIAELFAHYISILAPWYDLNDSERVFATVVPHNSLDNSTLFKALIAFSASHRSETRHDMQFFGPAFHAASVKEFLVSMSETELRPHDNELAATCLLRSYEIISSKNTLLVTLTADYLLTAM